MGAFGTTAENLQTAYDGEEYETAEMYPAFARVAEEEGFDQIAQYFRAVGGYEKQHRNGFKKALDSGA
ncbi:MAG TPA: ferritin family protein, partial [Coriobacteriia bacterium]|nr:ferritin family protein [Coriobacteriia bacterium]